jgi:hypothetical protein
VADTGIEPLADLIARARQALLALGYDPAPMSGPPLDLAAEHLGRLRAVTETYISMLGPAGGAIADQTAKATAGRLAAEYDQRKGRT